MQKVKKDFTNQDEMAEICGVWGKSTDNILLCTYCYLNGCKIDTYYLLTSVDCTSLLNESQVHESLHLYVVCKNTRLLMLELDQYQQQTIQIIWDIPNKKGFWFI